MLLISRDVQAVSVSYIQGMGKKSIPIAAWLTLLLMQDVYSVTWFAWDGATSRSLCSLSTVLMLGKERSLVARDQVREEEMANLVFRPYTAACLQAYLTSGTQPVLGEE